MCHFCFGCSWIRISALILTNKYVFIISFNVWTKKEQRVWTCRAVFSVESQCLVTKIWLMGYTGCSRCWIISLVQITNYRLQLGSPLSQLYYNCCSTCPHVWIWTLNGGFTIRAWNKFCLNPDLWNCFKIVPLWSHSHSHSFFFFLSCFRGT